MSDTRERDGQLNSRLKDEYWTVVLDCLILFHGLSASEARARAEELRASIEAPPGDLSPEIFYHAEPFDVASNLAGRELDLSKYRDAYDQILQQHGWTQVSSAPSGKQVLTR